MAENFQTDRKAAAKLLNVSVRTVDRYIASNRLSIQRRDNRIWLSKKDIVEFRDGRQVDTSDVDMSIDVDSQNSVDRSTAGVDSLSTPAEKISANKKARSASTIYKKLYEQTHEELKNAQKRLEGANYRVGQLESLVKESVPLLDHQRLLGEEKAERFQLEEEVETLRDKIERMKTKIKEETFSRKAYLIALFIILLLQPLWLLLLR